MAFFFQKNKLVTKLPFSSECNPFKLAAFCKVKSIHKCIMVSLSNHVSCVYFDNDSAEQSFSFDPSKISSKQ